MPTNRTNKGITGSLIAGALLVPLTAVAAAVLVGSIVHAQNAEAVSVPPDSMIIDEPAVQASVPPVSDTTFTACTSGAEQLLVAERDGTIDPLQIAALDALRQICEKEGLTIADPPTPTRVVMTVSQSTSGYAQDGVLAYDEDCDDEDHDGHHDEHHDQDNDHHDDEDDD